MSLIIAWMRPRAALVSESEFLALPETMNKVELLDGEVIVSPSPTFHHQEILRRIVRALSVWSETQERPITVCQSPLDFRFAPDRILQPDACVVLDKIPLNASMPLDRVPELCIEVLSNDRVYDRLTKRLVYAAAGVREYWVVETEGPIERWHGEGLASAEPCDERLVTPLLPGFVLDVTRLFAD